MPQSGSRKTSTPEGNGRVLAEAGKLALVREAGGLRHYLDGEPVHAGDAVELRLADGSWLRGRYEWSFDENDAPGFYYALRVDIGRPLTGSELEDLGERRPDAGWPSTAGIQLHCESVLRWPGREERVRAARPPELSEQAVDELAARVVAGTAPPPWNDHRCPTHRNFHCVPCLGIEDLTGSDAIDAAGRVYQRACHIAVTAAFPGSPAATAPVPRRCRECDSPNLRKGECERCGQRAPTIERLRWMDLAFDQVQERPEGWFGHLEGMSKWVGPFPSRAVAQAVRYAHAPAYLVCGVCGFDSLEERVAAHCQAHDAP